MTCRDCKKAKNPDQPFVMVKGIKRFKANALVRYLLDNGGIGMNQLAVAGYENRFSRQDKVQFAQLIGYSVSGFSELSYVSNKDWDRVHENPKNCPCFQPRPPENSNE